MIDEDLYLEVHPVDLLVLMGVAGVLYAAGVYGVLWWWL